MISAKPRRFCVHWSRMDERGECARPGPGNFEALTSLDHSAWREEPALHSAWSAKLGARLPGPPHMKHQLLEYRMGAEAKC